MATLETIDARRFKDSDGIAIVAQATVLVPMPHRTFGMVDNRITIVGAPMRGSAKAIECAEREWGTGCLESDQMVSLRLILRAMNIR